LLSYQNAIVYNEGYSAGVYDTAVTQVQNGIFIYPINETALNTITIQELCSGGSAG